MSLPLSETAPNAWSVTEPRSPFALSYGEGALALTTLIGAWFVPYSLVSDVSSWPVYWQDISSLSLTGLSEMKIGYSLFNAVSAVCAYRFLRRRRTRSVSCMGYAALSLPATQTALLTLTCGWLKPGAQPPPTLDFAIAALFVCSLIAHLGLSLFVSARSLRRADMRGDMVALPLLCAWGIVWFWVSIWIARNSSP